MKDWVLSPLNLWGYCTMKQTKRWMRLLAAVCAVALLLPLFATALAAAYPYDTVSMDAQKNQSRRYRNHFRRYG